MNFESFKFPEIRPTVNRKCLLDTGWLSYHINTEFKAKAAIYHYEVFEKRYNEYFENQPLPEAQDVFFFEHPLKEVIFFEFVAVTANLYSCFDSLLQEINCAYRLGLSEMQKKGQEHVTVNSIRSALKSKYPNNLIVKELDKLYNKNETNYEWLNFLKLMRNTTLHADIYSTSHEARNIKKILKLGFGTKVAENDTKTTDRILKEMLKRDIVIEVDGKDFQMIGLTGFLKRKMFEYISNIHQTMINDPEIGKRV